MKRITINLLLLLLMGQQIAAQIAFNQNGKFKIVQFTDLHYSCTNNANKLTLQVMASIIEKEKPDLVVLTGDLVTGDDVETGWRDIAAVMANKKTKWVAVLGNHDSEQNTKRHDVYGIMAKLPYIICSPYWDKGTYDFSLFIHSSASTNAAAQLFFFDSNEYAPTHLPGSYNWIKPEQVNWYRNESARIKTQNNNDPLPALAFLHIPLMEYAELKGSPSVVGHWDEDICSPKINTGLFAAMVECKDVMGVFAGHDHNNDYIGVLHDIALGYGRCTGFGGYGDLRQGARVIEITENKFQFRSWITTPTQQDFVFNFPVDLNQTTQNEPFLPAVELKKPLKQGIAFKYYEGEIKSVDNIANLQLVKTGIANKIDLSMAPATDYFAIEYEGFILIPANDVYHFYITSDDGAVLYIDDQKVVDNDGSHSIETKRGSIALSKGYHRIKIKYFESYMGAYLEIGMKSASVRESDIKSHWLFVQ